jgi:NADPH:quinone reductase-like Zn-dependent oxidoreductase
MRAVVSQPHTTEAQVIAVTTPVAGPGQVVIDVIAAGVNPIDHFVATGPAREGFGLEGTVGLGWDVVGRIAEIGADVSGLGVGDVVAGLDNNLGAPSRTHAERVVLPVVAVAPLPDGLDPVEAASVPLNSLTAAQALAILGEPAGRSLLVTGAAGAVGGYAVALASAAGWHVSGLARPSDHDFVRAAGGELVTELVTGPAGARYDAVLDTAILGGPAVAAAVDGGHYVGVIPSAPATSQRGVTVDAVNVVPDSALLAELLERSRTGELEVRVEGTAAIDDAAAVYAKAAGGGQRGRWLLLP